MLSTSKSVRKGGKKEKGDIVLLDKDVTKEEVINKLIPNHGNSDAPVTN